MLGADKVFWKKWKPAELEPMRKSGRVIAKCRFEAVNHYRPRPALGPPDR